MNDLNKRLLHVLTVRVIGVLCCVGFIYTAFISVTSAPAKVAWMMGLIDLPLAMVGVIMTFGRITFKGNKIDVNLKDAKVDLTTAPESPPMNEVEGAYEDGYSNGYNDGVAESEENARIEKELERESRD